MVIDTERDEIRVGLRETAGLCRNVCFGHAVDLHLHNGIEVEQYVEVVSVTAYAPVYEICSKEGGDGGH